jgi:hypothetical protein
LYCYYFKKKSKGFIEEPKTKKEKGARSEELGTKHQTAQAQVLHRAFPPLSSGATCLTQAVAVEA